jgi:histone-lysine N-methyltransferase SETMAR
MLYEFKQGNSATVATKNITDVCGNDALDVRKCQRWFKKFRMGDLSLEDDQHSGRPVEFDEGALSALVEADPYLSTEKLATKLNSTSSTVNQHLKMLGKISKLGKWVSHEFNSNEFVTVHKHLHIFDWPPRTGRFFHIHPILQIWLSVYHLF